MAPTWAVPGNCKLNSSVRDFITSVVCMNRSPTNWIGGNGHNIVQMDL